MHATKFYCLVQERLIVKRLDPFCNKKFMFSIYKQARYHKCAYYEYFSNWADTFIEVYFVYSFGLLFHEYRHLQSVINKSRKVVFIAEISL